MCASSPSIEQLAIDTIRTLSMDGVQAANSGHPGTPMALAPVAYSIWQNRLRYDPARPNWPVRDRFVLSCGHASMLLYSMLHLADVRKTAADGSTNARPAVALDDLKAFRQMHSPCAGHPEFGEAAGIETTTGPLGQGVSNAVGMAIAAKWFAARFDRPGFEIFGNDVYALCGDGDMMEGIASEAASLAGHLKLSNLCWIYDDNGITIEGRTDLAFTEDVAARFAGYGWNVLRVDDANDLPVLDDALQTFQATDEGPTLIIVRSVIGFGAPNKADTADAHGAPLGHDEIKLTKEAYGWPTDEPFHVPEGVMAHFAEGVGSRGRESRRRWETQWAEYEKAHPEAAARFTAIQSGRLPDGWDAELPVFPADAKGMASRVSSGKVLNALGAAVPWLLGGSADLEPSNKTNLNFEGAGEFGADDYSGRNFHFGVREHAMAAVANGMSLSGLRAYVATFFVFSDYLRPAMRLSALMRQPVLYIFTHDSIGVGEDGPTHQPVEQLAAARSIPNLLVLRPADANEVSEAYRTAISQTLRPAALVLTRQNLPTIDRDRFGAASGTARGGYVLADCDGTPEVILIGTGSEVGACLGAAELLTADGVKARVVSMPSMELFDEQDEAYRECVLPPEVTARVGVEAGVRQGWDKYLGFAGRFVGMDRFGISAPAGQLMEHFGFTPENVAAQAKAALGR